MQHKLLKLLFRASLVINALPVADSANHNNVSLDIKQDAVVAHPQPNLCAFIGVRRVTRGSFENFRHVAGDGLFERRCRNLIPSPSPSGRGDTEDCLTRNGWS